MRNILLMLLFLFPVILPAQQYSSLSGLIHVPSADMYPEGEVRIGAHFLHKEFMTDGAFHYGGYKFNTPNCHLGITPFPWLELGFTMTFMKDVKDGGQYPEDLKFDRKDRYLSIKIRPLKEGKWWPAIAIGGNDPFTTTSGTSQYFTNYFVAMSKHFSLNGHILAAHVTYRHWDLDCNSKWNGIVGGFTYQPAFQQNFRLIAEYTGDDVNVGFDWKLWKHVLIQSSLQNGKYFSGGVCLCLNLL